MKKKFLCTLLTIACVSALTACGNKETNVESESVVAETVAAEETTAAEETVADVAESEEEVAGDSSTTAGEYSGLLDWVASDECELTVKLTNDALADSGLTVDIYADDDSTLVYEYKYTEYQEDFDSIEADQIKALFDSQFDSVKPSLTPVFTTFESNYGFSITKIRCTFLNGDGSELYTNYVEAE